MPLRAISPLRSRRSVLPEDHVGGPGAPTGVQVQAPTRIRQRHSMGGWYLYRPGKMRAKWTKNKIIEDFHTRSSSTRRRRSPGPWRWSRWAPEVGPNFDTAQFGAASINTSILPLLLWCGWGDASSPCYAMMQIANVDHALGCTWVAALADAGGGETEQNDVEVVVRCRRSRRL